MPKVSLAQRPAPSADSPHPNPSPEGEGLETGRVYINPEQYFDDVPKLAWDFYIGGYQPAQKWLKDRRGRVLSYDDIGHYQKIIKILTETDRIMKEIKLPLHYPPRRFATGRIVEPPKPLSYTARLMSYRRTAL